MRRIGEIFGDFLLQGELGEGASGTVFQAQQISINRLVALKILKGDALKDPSARQRFRLEAEAAASLDHPSIVPVYELGESDGQVFLSLKLLTGGTLAEAVEKQALTPTAAAVMVGSLARAVDYAHSHGVLHRDIKPANILLDENARPHLTDFGLAKLHASSQALTATQTALGTPAYMAPEVAAAGAHAATSRSDIYSLGTVLYQALTGFPPYLAASPLAVLEMVRTQEPVPLRRRLPAVPRDLELICLKCLAREPGDRYGSAGELAEDLDRFGRGDCLSLREPTLAQVFARWFRRHRAVGIASVAIAFSLLIGVSATVWQWRRADGFLRESRAGNSRLSRSLALAEQREAENLTDRRRFHAAALKLAELLRDNPSNYLARVRLNAALSDDDWPWPVLPPLRHEAAVCQGVFHPDREHLLTASTDGWLHVWDQRSGELRFKRPHDTRRGLFALSRDGCFLATLGTNGAAVVWRLPNGESVFETVLPQSRHLASGNKTALAPSQIVAAAFDATSALLATAASDGLATLWNTTNGQPLATLDHGEPLREVSFAAAGRQLLTVGANSCRIWIMPVSSSAVVAERSVTIRPSGPPKHAEFSPDGAHLLTVAGDQVEIWNTRTGERQRSTRHPSGIAGAHFTQDGKRFAPFGPQGTWVQDVAAESQSDILLAHDAAITQACFSGDAAFVGMASVDGTARLRLVNSNEETLRPVRHEGPVLDVALSADGSHLLTCSADGTARLWIARRQPLEFPLTVAAPSQPLGFSPDGSVLAAAGTDHALRLFFVGDRSRIQQTRKPVAHEQPIHQVAFSPNGRRIASVDAAGHFLVAETAGTNDLTLPSFDSPATAIWWNQSDSQLAARTTNEVVVWNLDSSPPRLLARTNLPVQAETTFSPAGWHLAISVPEAALDPSPPSPPLVVPSDFGGKDASDPAAPQPTVLLFDLRDELRVPRVLQAPGTAARLTFSPDGRLLAALGLRGTIRLWNVADGRQAGTDIAPSQAIVKFGFSPDSTRLFTALFTGAILIWEVPGGRLVADLPATRRAFRYAEFSPDGEWMLTQHLNAQSRLWHVATGLPAGNPLRARLGEIQARLSNDGRRILALGADHRALLQRTPYTEPPPAEALVAMAEYVTGRRLDSPGQTVPLTRDEFLARSEVLRAAFGSLPPPGLRRSFWMRPPAP
jgi:WD40 repeat protein/tRNA A-37 threonylcarbamoyl transferase component Bud32